MKHRYLWSFAALYAANIFTEALGVRGWGMVFSGWIAYLATANLIHWEDVPSDWRIKCVRARVYRPKKQDKLWESAVRYELSRIVIFRIPMEEELLKKIDIVEVLKGTLSIDDENLQICDGLKVRGGIALVCTFGPPRKRGRGKRIRLPKFQFGKLPLPGNAH
jgi:hypothetical protein